MLFGNPSTFAIECFHDPIPNDNGWVFGRMAILMNGGRLGDIAEPDCMLNVTVGHLEEVLRNIDNLDETEFYELADAELFELLDCALYGNDDRSSMEVTADAVKYRKFDFLTNDGESFDNTKSFLVARGQLFRLIFRDYDGALLSAHFSRAEFESVVVAFITWLAHERENICA